ncbi:MAG: cation-translocating P-type ATPase [Christensenellales bacterium]
MEFWHTKTAAQTMKTLHTTDKGLSEKQARQTLETHGANELKHAKPKSVGRMFLEQMTDVMILVLLAAAAISACLGEAVDAAVILFIVVLNAIIGVVQQKRAEKSLIALKELSAPNAKVIRDGKELSVPAKELVPGDLVLLEAGDVVPADLRLVMPANLKVQEAALTGESLPVEKDATAVLDEKAPLGDRINMAFSSSVVTYGRGSGIVVETGMQTEVGRIAEMLMSEKTRPTPLQMKLAKLGKVLAMAAIGICVVIFVVGLLYGKPVLDMFFTAVSLAVAAIPEGLPAISTIVLAMSVQRMVKRNAIIRTLPSVEALGSATVICSDKTGTLTQNKMTVTHLFLQGKVVPVAEAAQLDRRGITLLGRIAALCNDARIVQKEGGTMAVGDPTEIALMEGAKALGLCKQQEETEAPRLAEYAFDSDRKLMSTVHKDENGLVSYTKGAPDVLLGRCTKIWENGAVQALTEEKREEILQANDKMAEQALRVLAMAYKPIDSVPQGQAELDGLEQDLIFVGMTGMIDPPREEAKKAVALCKQAGIHAVMITGDHKTTAVAIAKSLGILTEGKQAITGQELDALSDEQLAERVEDIAVYARISPEHKVRIVKAWQEKAMWPR